MRRDVDDPSGGHRIVLAMVGLGGVDDNQIVGSVVLWIVLLDEMNKFDLRGAE
jgi:hypothetical protein